ncbi:MAG: hypothetical protein JNM18_00235 [Planctomycetaceae bacterium]|nr:hypothetical protein [Planctomycetaceae bacterium]
MTSWFDLSVAAMPSKMYVNGLIELGRSRSIAIGRWRRSLHPGRVASGWPVSFQDASMAAKKLTKDVSARSRQYLASSRKRDGIRAKEVAALFGQPTAWSWYIPLPSSLDRHVVGDWINLLIRHFKGQTVWEETLGLLNCQEADDGQLETSPDPLVLVENDIAAIVSELRLPWDLKGRAHSAIELVTKLTEFQTKHADELKPAPSPDPHEPLDALTSTLSREYPNNDVPTLVVLLERLVQPWWWQALLDDRQAAERARVNGIEMSKAARDLRSEGKESAAEQYTAYNRDCQSQQHSYDSIWRHAYTGVVQRALRILEAEVPQLLEHWPAHDLFTLDKHTAEDWASRFLLLKGRVLAEVKDREASVTTVRHKPVSTPAATSCNSEHAVTAKGIKCPTDKCWQVHYVSKITGITNQTDLAHEMTKQGTPITQGGVSRALKKVDAYLANGGAVVPIDELSSRVKATSLNPAKIDMGQRRDGRTGRQRLQKDESDDD